eukprot:4318457-Alexandrium_andersonii.AAC.1
MRRCGAVSASRAAAAARWLGAGFPLDVPTSARASGGSLPLTAPRRVWPSLGLPAEELTEDKLRFIDASKIGVKALSEGRGEAFLHASAE